MRAQVRPLHAADAAAWRVLWGGYLNFYDTVLSDEQTTLTWQRLLDQAYNLHGLAAQARNGDLLGIAHYLFHPSSWSAQGYCYLEDLFVAPAARGAGVGRQLIEAVAHEARERGADKLYWLTRETNYAGRMLYDRLAQRTGFIHYALPFPAEHRP